jgi:GTPase SAR1 family protein
MAPLYYRDAAGALIVFDCTDVSSFAAVAFWIDELTNKGPGDIVVIVVANKCDIDADARVVSSEEAESFCRSRAIPYFEASALSGVGVPQVFQNLTDRVYRVKSVK